MQPKRTHTPRPTVPLRIATWNIENFGLSKKNTLSKAQGLAWAIGNHMDNPHIIALQEVCGDINANNERSYSAQNNAQKLINAIKNASGTEYKYAEIPPENHLNGGRQNAQIRCGFLYRTDRVALAPESNPAGFTSNEATIACNDKLATLVRNPCAISPTDSSFHKSRKPLLAQFVDKETGENHFIINIHWPLNQKSDASNDTNSLNKTIATQRIDQATLITDFTRSLTDAISKAGQEKTHHIIVCGDFNCEFNEAQSASGKPAQKAKEIARLENAGLGRAQLTSSASTVDAIFMSQKLAKRINREASGQKEIPHLEALSDHAPLMVSIKPPEKAISHLPSAAPKR